MTQTYTVADVTCGHCKAAIESSLTALSGVREATVDVAAKTVTVSGEAAQADVFQAIRDAGYTPS